MVYRASLTFGEIEVVNSNYIMLYKLYDAFAAAFLLGFKLCSLQLETTVQIGNRLKHLRGNTKSEKYDAGGVVV